MNQKIAALQRGETIISKEPGNSMTPRIKHRQPVKLAPATEDDVEVDDIVYCRVKGNLYTHLVKAKGTKGCLIGNNRGHNNGWTHQIYGKVIEVL